MSVWTNGNWKDQQALRQGFHTHYAHVRALVPKDRLLDFKSEDGWEPLCRFLQKQTPKDIPYPHVNDGNGVVKLHAFLYWIRLTKAVGRIGGTLGAVLVAGWAASWYLV